MNNSDGQIRLFRHPRYDDIVKIHVECYPRYWEDCKVNGVEEKEDEPTIFGQTKINGTRAWVFDVDRKTGDIIGWPKKKKLFTEVYYKVCDGFNCDFLDENDQKVASYSGYVPTFICLEDEGYGDYMDINIDETGHIQKWNEHNIGEVWIDE